MHPRPLRLPLYAMVLVALPVLALAHAVVQKASLDDTKVVAGKATHVTLKFNSGIEPKFTKVTLVERGGGERALAVAPASGPATVDVELPPLAAGTYGLRYKVLAVDGHVTEDVLRFTVTAEH
jgi:methionine-rich copper-binding protein CopC